jgi:hypothetical protein
MLSISGFFTQQALHNATSNVFNFIALLSAILLLLNPVIFVAHTGYNLYQAQTEAKQGGGEKKKHKSPKDHLHPRPKWHRWYAVAMGIHLLDAWFFRTIIPFFERARGDTVALPANDIQDLADICRLLWGIVRALSLFVIGLEIWDKRLELKTVLGKDWKNPRWGFAAVYLLAPAIVALSTLPVVIYFAFLALGNSTGFFRTVVRDAFTPDWRSGQDVFMKTATEVIKVVEVTPTAAKPAWKLWN